MWALFIILPVGALLGVLRIKASRARALSGTRADRPVFSVEPPTRRMSPRKWERL